MNHEFENVDLNIFFVLLIIHGVKSFRMELISRGRCTPLQLHYAEWRHICFAQHKCIGINSIAKLWFYVSYFHYYHYVEFDGVLMYMWVCTNHINSGGGLPLARHSTTAPVEFEKSMRLIGSFTKTGPLFSSSFVVGAACISEMGKKAHSRAH